MEIQFLKYYELLTFSLGRSTRSCLGWSYVSKMFDIDIVSFYF
jgi:hypothetical protein